MKGQGPRARYIGRRHDFTTTANNENADLISQMSKTWGTHEKYTRACENTGTRTKTKKVLKMEMITGQNIQRSRPKDSTRHRTRTSTTDATRHPKTDIEPLSLAA